MLKIPFKTSLQTTIMRKAHFLIIGIIAILLTTAKSTFAVETLRFTVQPLNMCLKKNESCTLTCTAKCGNSTIYYFWYETDQKGKNKTPLSNKWSESPELTVEPFTKKGIRYYVCGATADNNKVVYSKIIAVAYTGLPIISIETVDYEEPTATIRKKSNCIKDATKVPSRMWIYIDGKETAIYDSKDYVKKESGLTVKLRGNTSAFTPKKPYKLKLQKKEDLLGLIIGRKDKKCKDKEWVLLKDGTSLKTFVGLSVADIASTPWTPKFAYVNVVMNGKYRGIYMLVEAINRKGKHIDVADDGYIIEVDNYFFNEPVYFTTKNNRHFTFKYPDKEDYIKNKEKYSYIESYMNLVEEKIRNGNYEDYINTESFARWLLIQDILGQNDWKGSNRYINKYDSTTPEKSYNGTWSKIEMSTPWDFDWIYATENCWAKPHNNDRDFSTSLLINQNSAFIDSYQKQWKNISESLWNDLSTKMNYLKEEYGNDINLSRQLDAINWNTTYVSIEQDITRAKTWFTSRIKWLNTAINGMQKVIIPDFSDIKVKNKIYDGTDLAKYSGDITIKNKSSITEGDDVSLKITSVKFDSKDTDAKTVIVSFELTGNDKDKYTLINNEFYQLLNNAWSYYQEDLSKYLLSSTEEEIPAKILPKTLKNRIAIIIKKDF